MKNLNLSSPHDLLPDSMKEEVKVLTEQIETKFKTKDYQDKTNDKNGGLAVVEIDNDFIGTNGSLGITADAYMEKGWTKVSVEKDVDVTTFYFYV